MKNCYEILQTGGHTGRLKTVIWDVDMKRTEDRKIPADHLEHI